MRTRRRVVGCLFAVVIFAAAESGVAAAAGFIVSSSDPTNRFQAATDWAPPTVAAAVISPTSAGSPVGSPGFLHQLGTYRVYANISDTNSGLASATVNLVSESGSGTSAVTLVAGSYTLAGVSYTFASAQQTALTVLSEGVKQFSLTATDNASNATTPTFSVTIDNTIPVGSDIQTVNATGGTNGHPEMGDKVTFTFAEPIAPTSILAGWTGASANVVFRFINGSPTDSFAVYNSTNTTQLPLGTVNTGKKYVTGNINFGLTGTASSMVLSGSTITITLGTADNANASSTANGSVNMTWTPSITVTDRAANPMLATPVIEGGTADLDF